MKGRVSTSALIFNMTDLVSAESPIVNILMKAIETGHSKCLDCRISLLNEMAEFLEADGWISASFTTTISKSTSNKINTLECYRKNVNQDGLSSGIPNRIDPMDSGFASLIERLCIAKHDREPFGIPCFHTDRIIQSRIESELIFFKSNNSGMFESSKTEPVQRIFERMPWLISPENEKSNPSFELSPRHARVFSLLIEGDDRKSIADKLNVSIHTIGGYVKEVYRHYGVHSQTELVCKFHNRPPNLGA